MLLTLLSLLLLSPTPHAQAATLELCYTYDLYDKYFIMDAIPRASAQKRVMDLCVSHRKSSRGICRQNLGCQTLANRQLTRVRKIEPFPAGMRGPQKLPRQGRGSGSSSGRWQTPSTPSAPKRDKTAGGSCRQNNDCFAGQYCAGGQCFAKSGGGGGSCRSNNDCYSNDFCVSGQCFPKTGAAGGSCKENNDCYSYQFCVSGTCYEK